MRKFNGLALANGRQGDLVKAIKGGEVIVASYSKLAGYWVAVEQEDNTITKYMHMQNGLSVKVGENVKAGQTLGYVGNTGLSTGAHLHLQIEQNGNTIDPEIYLKNLQKEAKFKEVANYYLSNFHITNRYGFERV